MIYRDIVKAHREETTSNETGVNSKRRHDLRRFKAEEFSNIIKHTWFD